MGVQYHAENGWVDVVLEAYVDGFNLGIKAAKAAMIQGMENDESDEEDGENENQS